MSDYSFTADELAYMRETQTDHMLDECVIMVYTPGTSNEFNEADSPSYTASDPVFCGLDMSPASEKHGADMAVIEYDAILRIPIPAASSLKETDRVRITARFGENPDTLDYEIVSPIRRGPSGLRVLLRKIVI